MGMGRPNSSLRTVRLCLLALVVLAGIAFHHSGGVYDTIRVLYLALVIGFVVFAASTRRRRGRIRVKGLLADPGVEWRGRGSRPSRDRRNNPAVRRVRIRRVASKIHPRQTLIKNVIRPPNRDLCDRHLNWRTRPEDSPDGSNRNRRPRVGT